jgi:hypothetical protein
MGTAYQRCSHCNELEQKLFTAETLLIAEKAKTHVFKQSLNELLYGLREMDKTLDLAGLLVRSALDRL